MLQSTLLLFLSAVCLWIITSRRIHTGIFVTSGLMLLACGNLGMLDEFAFTERAYELRTEGMALVAWGFIWKMTVLPFWRNHLSAWWLTRVIARHTGVDRRHFRR